MLKIIYHPLKVVLLLVISSNCFSQTEIFDIVTYTPPKDWKKDAKPGVVNYTHVNTAAGTFCVLTIYASTASMGDAQKDFKKEWNELVVTPYKAGANPQTETQTTADGWKAVTGAAPIKLDGNDVYILLTVLSGFEKTVSIRCSMNDQSYSTQIDALFETMELDKTKTTAVNNNIKPAQTNGAAAKFGLMNYIAPAGWSEEIFSDGVVFKPLGLPADEHLAIQIMEPLNFSGTLEQAMEKSFEEATIMYNGTSMYQSDGKYSKNAAQKSFNGWEYIRGKGSIQVENGTAYKSEVGLEVFVIKINNRFERVAIIESRKYCGGVSRYYATDRISYRNGIEQFLYSLQFSDFNAAVLKSGSANGTGIVGVWEGTIQSTGAATGVRLEVFSPIFFNNGQVYFGNKFPTEGLDDFNSRIAPELYPRNWGTYTFNNGNGMLKMPFAEIPFRTQGDKIIVTKNQRDWPFYKLNSVDGAKFSGTYKMSESYEIIPVITFTADGKFNDNGVVRTLYHDGTNCINPGFVPGSGNYTVKDFTVTFNYTDGRKVKIAFLGTDYDKSNPSPATLRMSFNEDPMNRQ
ncbi:lipocalin-like domain-containing protein [Ferruginibacter sp.]